MAVHIITNSAAGLLKSFKDAIDKKNIETWSYDKDGDFTHTASSGQWTNKAWLRPSVKADRLVLNIVKPQNVAITPVIYAVYHGRFIESVLTHFDDWFTEAYATAKAQAGDQV